MTIFCGQLIFGVFGSPEYDEHTLHHHHEIMMLLIIISRRRYYGFLREGNLVVNGLSGGQGNLSPGKIYPLLGWENSLHMSIHFVSIHSKLRISRYKGQTDPRCSCTISRDPSPSGLCPSIHPRLARNLSQGFPV